MIFVSSDWHGCEMKIIEALLQKADFCEEDELYVLGDVIDRGEHGIKLLRWLMEQPNMELILGNHESMLLSCRWLFDEISDESIASVDEEKMTLLLSWMKNGAEPTIASLREMSDRSAAIEDILDYLYEAPLYEAISTDKNDFLLTHAGLGHFAPNKKLSQYSPEDLLWNRPLLTDNYFDGVITVFGHTPTEYYGNNFKNRILVTDTWIDIDTGSGHGGKPCLLRLDDWRAFYL